MVLDALGVGVGGGNAIILTLCSLHCYWGKKTKALKAISKKH